MSKTNANRPTHRIYAVTKGDDNQSNWKDIGAAWPHKDGKGFNLRLEHIPLNGAELVVREAKPKTSQADAKGGVQ